MLITTLRDSHRGTADDCRVSYSFRNQIVQLAAKKKKKKLKYNSAVSKAVHGIFSSKYWKAT